LASGDNLWACSAAAEAAQQALRGLAAYLGEDAAGAPLPDLALAVEQKLGATSAKLESAARHLAHYAELAEMAPDDIEGPQESEARALIAAAARVVELARGVMGLP
jgi:HEPN domain-containing protein